MPVVIVSDSPSHMEFLKIMVSLLSGGFAGALINEWFRRRNSRLQPIPLIERVNRLVDPVLEGFTLARVSRGPAAQLERVDNLREYHAISIDVGDQDGLRIDTGKLHDVLDQYGISNGFEIYKGTHTSAVADRFQHHVMPFFSKNLCFEGGCN